MNLTISKFENKTRQLSKSENRQEIFLLFLLVIIFIVGCIFRFKGLGKWPLAVDEYYIVKSSQNILKYGLPQWDAGGYYGRGLPQQYLTALFLWFGLKAEFAARLIPLLSNLAAIPGLYLLTKKVSNLKIAVGVVLIFTLSVWEVEFSRFARMYTMFQSIFIWYLYFLYKKIIEKDEKALKWVFTLSSISIFVYEGAIFLILLNFLPLFWNKDSNTLSFSNSKIYRESFPKLITAIVIFAFAYFFLTFNFRTLFQHNLLPPDVVEYQNSIKASSILRLPVLLIQSLPSSKLWLFIFTALLTANLFVYSRIVKSEKNIQIRMGGGLLIILSFLNLLGLMFVTAIIFLMLGWLEPKEFRVVNRETSISRGWHFLPGKFLRYFILIAAINFFFNIFFILQTTEWKTFFPHHDVTGSASAIKTVLKESLNYPYLYESFVLFRDTIPFATIIYLLLIGALGIFVIKKYYSKGTIPFRFLLFLFLILVVAQNILNLTYFDTRYFFFLYPLVIILAVLGLERMVELLIRVTSLREYAFGAAFIPILFFSEDFNLKHLARIDSPEINFRMNMKHSLVIHYYPRWDSETPADVVDKESSQNDLIISNEQPSEFYLNRLDYIFRDYRGIEFSAESVLSGTKERWTNAKMIYRYSDFNNMIDTSHQKIWLLLNTMWKLDELDSMLVKYDNYLYYQSIDGRTLLYKIPPVESRLQNE